MKKEMGGMHKMPNGTMMKDSEMKEKKMKKGKRMTPAEHRDSIKRTVSKAYEEEMVE